MKNILLAFLIFIIFGIEKLEAENTPENTRVEDCDNTDFETDKPDYAETEEERMARLNQELMTALNQFDRCFETASETNSSQSSGASESSSTASNSASGNEPVESENNSLISLPDKNSIPIAENPGDNGSTQSNIPYDSTDDKTAKQLRQVANSETDPKLRDQYIEGYRIYKESLK